MEQRKFGHEDSQFVTEVGHNKFLEREEEYRKMNEELEKKTAMLFAKMDKYWKSKSSVGDSQLGDGDSISDFGTDDGQSFCSERPYSARSSFNEEYDDCSCRGGGDADRQLNKSVNKKNAVSPRTSVSGIQLDEITSPRLKKQKSRLQRATENVINSLQAKLLNHEERLTDLHLQYRQKIQENTMQESKIKALEEERERLLRTISNQQNIVEKHAKNAENSKSNLNLTSQTVSSLKREIEDLRKERKSSNSSCQSYQVKLQRLTEENEKLKGHNKSLSLQLREAQSEFKLKLDEKQQKILELEKQRNMLNSTVNKQTQSIKMLREPKNRSRTNCSKF